YYGGAFGLTAALSFWEVGLSGWQLIPRLVGPFVILVLAILVAPALDQPLDGVHASGAWSALESLLPRSPFSSRSSISTRHRFNYQMHVQPGRRRHLFHEGARGVGSVRVDDDHAEPAEASLLIIGYLALGALLQLLVDDGQGSCVVGSAYVSQTLNDDDASHALARAQVGARPADTIKQLVALGSIADFGMATCGKRCKRISRH